MGEKDRIDILVEELNHYTELYNKGISPITDQQWDLMYNELVALEAQTGYKHPNSPTQIIWSPVLELETVQHNHPMLSLDKTKDLNEIKSFIGNKEWIAMLKMDGLTCSLLYEGGRLVRAETRGNGVEGEDITHNARAIRNIPERISHKGRIIIDGEVIITYKDFAPFKDKYANPRNLAAGSIRLLDPREAVKRNMTFVAWDIIDEDVENFANLTIKLEYLDELGFTVVSYRDSFMFSYYTDSVVDFLKAEAEDNSYPIDGIVFKYNNCAVFASQGRTQHHFRGGLAFKFYDTEYETTLTGISWTMGRLGTLTPVAIYEEVNTGDSILTKASLHNVSIMREMLGANPYYGQRITVAKMNDIIPQITTAEIGNPDRKPATVFEVPDSCPYCGAPTKIIESDSGTLELICEGLDCPCKLINRLDHFCGKKGLDIKGLSKARLENLINYGWVNNFIDIFKLEEHKREWANKPGYGVASVNNILKAICAGKECELENFISALGIPQIGKTNAKILAQEFKTWENFISAVNGDYNFTKLNGFGGVLHFCIKDFDYTEANKMIDEGYIYIKAPAEEVNSAQIASLSGKNLVITGKLQNFKNRDELVALIEKYGGKVVSTISSKTNYLINNDINSTSTKNVKAKQLGVKIISENDLLELIQTDSSSFDT